MGISLSHKLDSLQTDQIVPEMNALLQSTHVRISWWAQRMVSIDGYEGEVEINVLAKKCLQAPQFQDNHNASLVERIACYDVCKKVAAIYQQSVIELGKTWIYWLLTPLRELACSGADSMFIVSMSASSTTNPLFQFTQEEFKELWPDSPERTSTLVHSGNGSIEKWFATKEMIDQAIQKTTQASKIPAFIPLEKDNVTQKLLEEVAQFLATPDSLKDVPRANNGNTPVYFPDRFPTIILKEAGIYCRDRLKQMEVARTICKKIENGSTLLVIPKAFGIVAQKYLVEERLPLQEIKDFAQQSLYCCHQKELETIICAITHFVLQSAFSDLIEVYESFPRGYSLVRYDNIPLFMTKEGLRVGLIDLEKMGIMSTPPQQASMTHLEMLVYIYPYHKEVILKAASSYFSEQQLASAAEELNKQEANGKKFLQIGYFGLKKHLEQHEGRTIVLSNEIKNRIIHEMDVEIPKNGTPLTSEEKKAISTTLDEIVKILNQVKKPEKEPVRGFNSALFRSISDSQSYKNLEWSLSFNPRQILVGTTLYYYLLQKLEKYQVIYACSIAGFNAILVD